MTNPLAYARTAGAMSALAAGIAAAVAVPPAAKAKEAPRAEPKVQAPSRKPRPSQAQAQAAVDQAQALKEAGAGNRAVLVAARSQGMGSAVGYRPHQSTREIARRAKRMAAGKAAG